MLTFNMLVHLTRFSYSITMITVYFVFVQILTHGIHQRNELERDLRMVSSVPRTCMIWLIYC